MLVMNGYSTLGSDDRFAGSVFVSCILFFILAKGTGWTRRAGRWSRSVGADAVCWVETRIADRRGCGWKWDRCRCCRGGSWWGGKIVRDCGTDSSRGCQAGRPETWHPPIAHPVTGATWSRAWTDSRSARERRKMPGPGSAVRVQSVCWVCPLNLFLFFLFFSRRCCFAD